MEANSDPGASLPAWQARPVRVLLAPDAFAGTLTAPEAADALAAGWSRAAPGDALTAVPLSDGGPGFLEVLTRARSAATLVPATVADPLGRPVPAAVLLDGADAYVESAEACGLHLLAAGERDPERTSTRGVGELLAAAVATGATRVVVGLGGSATHDGGRGAVEALGRAWPAAVELVVASDVDVPLADAAFFAAQKGATPEQLPRLAARLDAWADELEVATGRRVRRRDGAGAAGGLGFGLLALGGHRAPGIGVVADAVGLRACIAAVDLVITGEGRYDATSLRGKVCGGVARLAQEAGVPCLVLAGGIEVGVREARAAGVDEMRSAAELAGSPEAAQRRPAHWLAELAARAATRWSRG